jgi:hypothetical protein
MKPKHLAALGVLLLSLADVSLPSAQKPAQPTELQKLKERVGALESRQKTAQQRADTLDSDIKALQQKADRAEPPPPTSSPSNAPNWIMAFFTVVIAGATVAYVVLTKRLWQETKKSAEAAKNSADVLDRQMKQEADRCKFALRAGVATALEATEFWKKRIGDLVNLVGRRELPPTHNLNLPYSIAESGSLTDINTGLTLSLVLDDMRTARDLIESVRNINNEGGANNGPIERAREEAATLLANAHEELTELSAAFDAPNG